MGYLYTVAMILLLMSVVQIKGLFKSSEQIEKEFEQSQEDMMNNPFFTKEGEEAKKTVNMFGVLSMLVILGFQISFVILSLAFVGGKVFIALGAIYLFFVLRNVKSLVEYIMSGYKVEREKYKAIRVVSVLYQTAFVITAVGFLITL